MRTYRRLDDATRYYGLSWRGWLAATAGGGALYLFVRISPFDTRATISVVLVACVLPAMAAFAAGGQALGLGRYLLALLRWALGPKDYALADQSADRRPAGGVVLEQHAPSPDGNPDASGSQPPQEPPDDFLVLEQGWKLTPPAPRPRGAEDV